MPKGLMGHHQANQHKYYGVPEGEKRQKAYLKKWPGVVGWLGRWEHVTIDLGIVSLSPTSGVQLTKKKKLIQRDDQRGAWVAQLVKHPTSAQVVISRFMGSSPTSGSVLTAQSPEPVSDSVSPSLSAPPLLMVCLCLKNK